MLKTLIVIGSGGALGAVSRHLIRIYIEKHISVWLSHKHSFFVHFPLSTFFVNLLGSFVLGIVITNLYSAVSEKNPETIILYQFLVIGFLSAFTTFSAISMETYFTIANQQYFYATLYLTLSILLGVFGFFLGFHFIRF